MGSEGWVEGRFSELLSAGCRREPNKTVKKLQGVSSVVFFYISSEYPVLKTVVVVLRLKLNLNIGFTYKWLKVERV